MIVLSPILDNFEISFKSETPLIKEPKINGTAINFNALINIFPKGLIQWRTKSSALLIGVSSPFTKYVVIELPQEVLKRSKLKTTPSAIPIKIFQCKASFFFFFSDIVLDLCHFIAWVVIQYSDRCHCFNDRHSTWNNTRVMTTFSFHLDYLHF